MKDAGTVELLPPAGQPAQHSPQPTGRRLRVFVLVFLPILIIGLGWDFMRPPLYRVTATLLTVAPPELGERGSEADLQHVAIQRQHLLGQKVLERVADALAERGEDGAVTPDRLRALFQVLPVPETNLVELRAEGEDPVFLSAAVNAWLDAYLKARAEEVADLEARTTEVLQEQYQAMGRLIEEKRARLQRFREENEILSTARDENQILARLKGLNESLNAANEARIKAQARLDAIEQAIARGETLVPEEDKRHYAEMVRRAQELREQVAELDRRYTKEYIERSPSLKVIPEKLAQLEAKLAAYREKSRDYLLSNARQELAAAETTVQELERQLEAMKAEASEFTARFAEYEAMQEDLAALELRYRELEDRLVQVRIANKKKYPQVQVVEWAYPPADPIEPDYWRDAALVVGVALLAGLLAVWVVDYLRPPPPAPVATVGVALYPAHPGLPGGGAAAPPGALEGKRRVLPKSEPELPELAPDRVRDLLEAGDRVTRQLLALLLIGLSPQEILDLDEKDLDPESGQVRVRGASQRTLLLPPAVRGWFLRDGRPWLAWRALEAFDEAELDARIVLAARDAGVEPPPDAETLRNSYLLYLVRQGLRLGELEKVAGLLPARRLAALERAAPEGRGRTLEEVVRFHPALQPIV